MTARGAGRPTGRLASAARAARVRLRHRGRRAALVLVLVAGLGACCGLIAGAPARASGEGGGSPSSGSPSGGSPGESGSTGTSSCPSSNPPNQLTLVAGTPQTTTPADGVCERTAGRADEQRWLRRHRRRRRPGHVHRPRGRRQRGVLGQRLEHRHGRRRRLRRGRRADIHRQRHSRAATRSPPARNMAPSRSR